MTVNEFIASKYGPKIDAQQERLDKLINLGAPNIIVSGLTEKLNVYKDARTSNKASTRLSGKQKYGKYLGLQINSVIDTIYWTGRYMSEECKAFELSLSDGTVLWFMPELDTIRIPQSPKRNA